jgi:hypothetical protein
MIQKHVLRIVTDVLKQNLNIKINKTQGVIGQSQSTMSTYEYHFKTTLVCFRGHCLILLPLMYPNVICACLMIFFINTKSSTRGPKNYIVVCVHNLGEGRGGSEIKLDKNTKDQNMRPKQSSGNPLWVGYLLITSNLDQLFLMFFPVSCPNYPIHKKKEERDISHPMLNHMVNCIK